MLIFKTQTFLFGFFLLISLPKPNNMKFFLFTFSILIFTSFSLTAQEAVSLENQFDNLYRKSTSYKSYKVINKQQFLTLKKSVVDIINTSKEEYTKVDNQLKNNKEKTARLQEEITTLKTNLQGINQQKDSISLFGIQLNKTTYNLILWGLIVALLLGLGYFVFKFTNSNVLTEEAQQQLTSVEHEFDVFRKKSIEREQKLRRQLLDEENKNKKEKN